MSTANVMKKVINPNFCEDAGEYLEENGYNRSDSKLFDDSIYYSHNSMAVIIYKDCAKFMMRHDEDDDRGMHYSCFAAFDGIHQLELFDWMLLFHITGIVTIRDFAKRVREQEPEFNTVTMFKSLMQHFQAPEQSKAIPSTI